MVFLIIYLNCILLPDSLATETNQTLFLLRYKTEHSVTCHRPSCPYGKGPVLALKPDVHLVRDMFMEEGKTFKSTICSYVIFAKKNKTKQKHNINKIPKHAHKKSLHRNNVTFGSQS